MQKMNADEQLIEAAQYGDLNLAKAAIEEGADVDAVERGCSALHWAAQEGHLAVVRLLVARGATVNTADEGGFTPLHQAVGEERADIVSFLLESGADVNARCPADGNGTPLHTACAYGRTECVKLLLYRGADINARDDSRLIPLDYAKMHGHAEVAALNEQRGARQTTQGRRAQRQTEELRAISDAAARGASPDPPIGWRKMRYFTRELYQRYQPVEGMPDGEIDRYEAVAEGLWDRAEREYEEHLQSVKPVLPKGARRLLDCAFHDSVVESVTRTGATLRMDLDTRYAPSMEGDQYALHFHGVTYAEGVDSIAGDDWLYKEVHVPDDGAFELRVLCFKGEFCIAAEDLEIEKKA